MPHYRGFVRLDINGIFELTRNDSIPFDEPTWASLVWFPALVSIPTEWKMRTDKWLHMLIIPGMRTRTKMRMTVRSKDED